jgi:Tfp pilus assembly protein PilN
MGLVRCGKCRHLFNTRDKFCPKCQEPMKPPFKRLWTVLGGLVLLGWAVLLLFYKD